MRTLCWTAAAMAVTVVAGACAGSTPRSDPRVVLLQGSDELEAAYAEALDVTPIPSGGIATRIDWSRNTPILKSEVLPLVQWDAHCDWYAHWLRARDVANGEVRARALDMMGRMKSWDSFRDTSFVGELEGLATAAARDDPVPLQQQFLADGTGNCSPAHLAAAAEAIDEGSP